MFNQRCVGFIGTDRNNLFPKSFVQGLFTLSVEFAQQADEVRVVAMDVLKSDGDFLESCEFRGGKPAMSAQDEMILSQNERLFDTKPANTFGKLLCLRILDINRAGVEFIVLR